MTITSGAVGFVDLALLHRRLPAEAFITELSAFDADAFTATALLPADHPHYGGHAGAARTVPDLMLLLECCRQAETAAAHVVFDVEEGTSFVLRRWSARLTDAVLEPAPLPREAVLTAATANRREIGGRLRGLDYEFLVESAGRVLAEVRLSVGYLSQESYTVARNRGRTTPPITSDAVPHLVGGEPVAPGRVGRIRETDTVLLDVSVGADQVTAVLRLPLENPSMFEHTYDHVPGMVLQEAARQLGALTVAELRGDGPESGNVTADGFAFTALESEFRAFTDLDRPVRLTAVPDGAGTVEVSFEQDGVPIARTRVTHRGVGTRPDAVSTHRTDKGRPAVTETEQRIAAVLTRHFKVDAALLTDVDTTFEALAFDSLALIEVSLALEKEFDVRVEDGELTAEHTLGTAATLIDEKVVQP